MSLNLSSDIPTTLTPDMQDHNTSAFGMRQLNPFRGVLQVFLSDRARALSANGRVWEIQVLSDSPQGLWANIPFGSRQFYTFGLWSAETGLRQVPINPLFNIGDMISSAEALIAGLRTRLDDLPFPLLDGYEAWLLDRQGSPLALLQSSRSETERGKIEDPRWIAVEPGDSSFVSSQLLKRGQPNEDDHSLRNHADLLEALVNDHSGQSPRCLWYHRHSDGSATPCDEPETRLPAESFPELPLREDWPEKEQSELIGDYIRWKAPQLLMLPALTPDTRGRLERLAVKQAQAVDRLWRLYPQIHNQNLLKQARVEARIRTANNP